MLYQSPGASTFASPPPISDVSMSTDDQAHHSHHHQHDDMAAQQQQQHRIRNQLEDHSQMYGGSHWFAGGSIPDTHVVGRAVPAAGGRANPPPHRTNNSSNNSNSVGASAHYHDFSSYLFEQRDVHQQSQHQAPTPQRRSPQRSGTPGRTPHQHGKVLPSPFTAPRIQTTPSSHTPGPSPSSNNMVQRSPQRLGPHGQWERDGDVQGSTEYQSGQIALRGAQDHASGVTHWDASGRMVYDVDVRPSTRNMSTGIPRGFGGLDTIPAAARQAQRNIEDMQQDVARIRKLELQRKLREDLDQQIRDKQQRKLKEWEAEVVTVYGPAMVLDDSQRRKVSKSQHQSLQGVWRAQAAEASRRKAEEDAYYKPYEENWNDLKSDMERMRHDDVSKNLQRRQNSWLEAWKDQQAAEGEMKKAAAAERHRQEQLSVAPHIANYSDRILLAEQQKREAHAAYNNALREQVHDRNRRKYEELANEYANDPGVNSYHRAPVQRSWNQEALQDRGNFLKRV